MCIFINTRLFVYLYVYISNALLEFIYISKNIWKESLLKSWIWEKRAPGWGGDQVTACTALGMFLDMEQLS